MKFIISWPFSLTFTSLAGEIKITDDSLHDISKPVYHFLLYWKPRSLHAIWLQKLKSKPSHVLHTRIFVVVFLNQFRFFFHFRSNTCNIFPSKFCSTRVPPNRTGSAPGLSAATLRSCPRRLCAASNYNGKWTTLSVLSEKHLYWFGTSSGGIGRK